MRSVMQHDFSRVPAPQIQRSTFSRNQGHKTTFNSGYLVPIFYDEILPGDTMSLDFSMFGRLATLDKPIMDNLFMDVFFFFCPTRLLWDNWQKFNGERINPTDSIDYECPHLEQFGEEEFLNFPSLSLADYFGLPTKVDISYVDSPNAFLFRMYNLVYNDWFRDENLQDSLIVPKGDGPDIWDQDSLYILRRRGKRHDYFTSCLPWPQKGEAAEIPITGLIPVFGTGESLGLTMGSTGLFGAQASLSTGVMSVSAEAYGVPAGNAVGTTFPGASRTIGVTVDPANSGLVASLTAGNINVTINALRESIAIQQLLERDARGGTRYIELLYSQFGVRSPDYRLQRPEYLGGLSRSMNVSQVAQQSESGTTPQANLAAYGTAAMTTGFHHSFTEHGYVLGLVNVRSDIGYQQQIHRMWSRRTRYDFYMPVFANLGEQAVYNKEICYDNEGLLANEVFGYQERWAEYRYGSSKVTGAFRSNYTGTLDIWHLATNYGGVPPSLNGAFIEDTPPVERVITIEDEPQILLDTLATVRHTRPMPIYSVPGLRRL